MKIFYSSGFLRSFKRLPLEIQNIYRSKEEIFRQDQFDPRLRTHKLKGRNEWSFLVTYKIRVIFIFVKDDILLVNVGDHSIYRK